VSTARLDVKGFFGGFLRCFEGVFEVFFQLFRGFWSFSKVFLGFLKL